MNRPRLAALSLVQSLAAVAYVAGVGTLMFHANQVFGRMERSVVGPIAFLMLFCTSAAVMGLLLFGRPVYLYWEGRKREAIAMALMNVGFFAVITAGTLLFLASRPTP
jgi:hypothetical protein